MIVTLKRFSTTSKNTLGLYLIDSEFQCFSLEDPTQDEKIDGNTRIPQGIYPLKLNTESPMNKKYAKRYPDIHIGMIEICDIPNFTSVFLHCGNDENDTEGCPLTGNVCDSNVSGQGKIYNSREAYESLYPKVSKKIKVEKSYIRVTDHV